MRKTPSERWVPQTVKHLLILDAVLVVIGVGGYILSTLMLGPLSNDCDLQQLIGAPCPACGGTRFAASFLSGRFIDAFWHHPFFFCTAIALMAILLILHIHVLTRHRRLNRTLSVLTHPLAVIIWAILFVLFGVIRAVLFWL